MHALDEWWGEVRLLIITCGVLAMASVVVLVRFRWARMGGGAVTGESGQDGEREATRSDRTDVLSGARTFTDPIDKHIHGLLDSPSEVLSALGYQDG